VTVRRPLFQFKRTTAAEWTTKNPVLLVAEPGVETNTGQWKIGDGTTPWNDLPYATSPANNLAIGSVTTGAAGANASAEIVGENPDQELNLVLPRGATGPANSLTIGTVTTGAPGASATADITGAAPNQVLDLLLPKGDTGGVPTGTGSPEGVRTAPVGSMYVDTAATNGAIIWQKVSGSGNTGWAVVYGDTGRRQIDNGDLQSGFANYLTGATGHYKLNVRRVGNMVRFSGAINMTGPLTAENIWPIPVGYRPHPAVEYGSFMEFGGAPRMMMLSATSASLNAPYWSSKPANLTSGAIAFTYYTNDAWPTTLAGTAY
jgi:hypothetical protein